MKKYLLKRIIFSLFSLAIVVIAVSFLIFKAMDREAIFNNDTTYSRLFDNEQEVYKYAKYQEYGYVDQYLYSATEQYENATQEEQFAADDAIFDGKEVSDLMANPLLNSIITEANKNGFTTNYLVKKTNRRGRVTSSAFLLFYKDKNIFVRFGDYVKNMFKFEKTSDVEDENLTDRYIRFEWDKRSNMPALVGKGTEHKYLIYFDNKFPFVHQNLFHLNLGKSYTLYKGKDVTTFMKSRTGEAELIYQVAPKDIDNPNAVPVETDYDFHNVTYNYSGIRTIVEDMYYPEDEVYTNAPQLKSGQTRIGISFTIGIIAVVAAYIVGIPVGIWMAQRKDKLVDKIGNLYIIFIMAVPSLAYIFMFAYIGTKAFDLPYKFAFAEVKTLAYILPIISLALPTIGGLMKWMRRYMVDQQNSDYVKFARSQGLSEGEIFTKHISKNAFIFLVHNIPADILSALVGAIITERVYGIPGVGNMLTSAISANDNNVIIGVTVFYTALSITALLLGDLLLIKYDPRISLTDSRN